MTRRELVSPKNDKGDVRRDGQGQFNQGQFKESDDVGRSLSQDRRKRASTQVKPGHGDGDQRRH